MASRDEIYNNLFGGGRSTDLDTPSFKEPAIPGRDQIYQNLFGDSGTVTPPSYGGHESVMSMVSPKPVIAPQWTPKTGGGGFGGLLGDIIGVIDTPRAFLVSTIKETGDLIRGDGFDFGEWYNQIGDNIMMGEVLRDWDVDLPGPLDFIVGLGLDIALDPLTYLAGAGVAARFSNPAKVVTALERAAKTASKADAALLRSAAGRVAAKKSILAAGDEALQQIGMSAGLRFTLPGTGRLGRRIAERPLRFITGRGSSLDLARVRQLPGAKLPKGSPNPWMYKAGSEALDLSDNAVRLKVVSIMDDLRKGRNVSKVDAPFVPLAQQAMRMPVEAIVIPGTKKFVQVVGGGAGTLFGAAAATRVGRYIGKGGKEGKGGLSPDYDWHAAFRKYGRDAAKGDQNAARMLTELSTLRYARDKWIIQAGKWESQTLTDLESLYRNAGKLGIEGEDFSKWMLQAAEESKQINGVVNPRLYDFEPRIFSDPAYGNLHDEAVRFWDGMGQRGKEALGDAFALVQDELYVARYLSDEIADQNLFNFGDDFVEIIRGDAMKGRKFAVPNTLAREISASEAATLVRRFNLENTVQMHLPQETWRTQLGDAINGLAERDIAVTVRTSDGRTITNSIHDGALVNGRGVRGQIDELGSVKFGGDYKGLYSLDFNKTIVRYLNQVGKQIRVKGIVKELEEAGIFARGIDKRVWSKAVDDEMKRLADVESAATVRYGVKETAEGKIIKLEGKIQRHAQKLAKLESELEQIGVIKAGQTLDDVTVTSRRVVEARVLADRIRQMEEALANVRHVISRLQAGEFDAIADLSIEAFDLLVPASLRTAGSDRVLKGTRRMVQQMADRPKHLASIEEAADYITSLAAKVGEVYNLRLSIQQTLANLDDPALAGIYTQMLDDLDALLLGGMDDLRALNRTYLNNMLDDPTVRSADLLTAMADEYDSVMRGLVGPEMDQFIQGLTAGTARTKVIKPKDIADAIPGNYTNSEKALLEFGAALGDQTVVNWVKQVNMYRKLAAELHPDNLYITLVRESAEASRQAGAPVGYLDDVVDLPFVREKISLIEARLAAKQGGDVAGLTEELEALKNYELELQGKVQAVSGELDENISAINRVYDNEATNMGPRRANDAEEVQRLRNAEIEREMMIENARLEAVTNLQLDMQSGILPRQLRAIGYEQALGLNAQSIDNQLEAIKLVNNARGQAGLSDLYGDAVSDWFVNFADVTGLSASSQRALRGQNLLTGSVPKQVADEYAQLYAEAFQAMARLQDPLKFNGFLRGYSRFLNYWKAQAVSTPGFFMRNGMGGMWINNQIANVPMHTHVRVWAIRRQANSVATKAGRPGDIAFGLDELIAKGGLKLKTSAGGTRSVSRNELRTYKEWFETNIAQSGQVSQEVRTMLDLPGAGKRGRWNPFSAEFKWFNVIRRRNQDTEFILRGALAHHMMTGGQSAEDAYRAVTKYHFDYSNLTAMDQAVKQVVPFWTWQKNILPVLIESMGKQPRAWSRLNQVKRELELQSPIEGTVSQYIGENMGIRLPFKVGGNRVYTMPDLPFRDLNRYLKEMEGDTWYERATNVKGLGKGAIRAVGESALPVFKLPIEVWAGKQVFANLPLTGRYQQMPVIYDVPILRDVLVATGLAEKSPYGRYTMRDTDAYALDGLMPLFGRLRRLLPNERRKQEALLTTAINTTFGLGLRVNTNAMKRSEIIRQQREWADEWERKMDIAFRTR